MKIVIINGQNHKGSTYKIARSVAEKAGGPDAEITEYFLPKDFGSFCLGCTQCFMKAASKCPHYEQLSPITAKILEADLIVLSSPVYVYHVTGSMKAFLDHYGYLWMAHRPEEAMFKKQAICVTTAAGAGMKSTIKDMSDSLFFWGIAKQYHMGFAIKATSWNQISEKNMKKIQKKIDSVAKKVQHNANHVKPGLKTKAFFFLMHLLEKNGWNQADVDYWHAKNWVGKDRPWK